MVGIGVLSWAWVVAALLWWDRVGLWGGVGVVCEIEERFIRGGVELVVVRGSTVDGSDRARVDGCVVCWLGVWSLGVDLGGVATAKGAKDAKETRRGVCFGRG